MHNAQQDNSPILSGQPNEAVKNLTCITESLIDLAERELQVLLQTDMLSLAALQDEKKLLSEHYQRAAAEFRDRLEFFRKTDKALLDRLERAQGVLGDKMRANNNMVVEVRERAQPKTNNTLLSAQEYSEKAQARRSVENIVPFSQTAHVLNETEQTGRV